MLTLNIMMIVLRFNLEYSQVNTKSLTVTVISCLLQESTDPHEELRKRKGEIPLCRPMNFSINNLQIKKGIHVIKIYLTILTRKL